MLETYGHGGDLETAAQRFGIAREELLDFSANINPLGPPPNVTEAIIEGLSSIIHYPDPGHRRLNQLLAARLGLQPECIIVGNGAAECMALALLGLNAGTVGIAVPCFSEYGQLAVQFGAKVLTAAGTAEQGFIPALANLRRLIAASDAVFLGSPNNPTGTVYSLGILHELVELAEEHGTYLIMDEAFIDFIPPEERITLLPELHRYPHLILIHSMTKFYAIPGLRLGYAAAHPETAAKLRGKQVTWSVNALALLAGEACLGGGLEDYEQRTRELIKRQREWLVTQLSTPELGLRIWPSAANFLLLRLPETWTASEFQQSMGRRGIMIRSCAMYEGLTPQDIRVAVRSAEDNIRLVHTMREVLGERGIQA
ncbi:threonine-phosphate decarboxylase CobD [Paenibacillus gansuensis]|uniref:threonine-phosphate decarboxylase n=1 Tax=Paenibacillus gansuensis TaxID=306542 RepID=A0ABW5P9Z4_9BACL